MKRKIDVLSRRLDFYPLCAVCGKPSMIMFSDNQGFFCCKRCLDTLVKRFANVTIGELVEFLDKYRDNFKSGLFCA